MFVQTLCGGGITLWMFASMAVLFSKNVPTPLVILAVFGGAAIIGCIPILVSWLTSRVHEHRPHVPHDRAPQ